MRVDEKVVVVTGAARGIGRALAERFVREGARAVVAADLDATTIQATAAQIGAAPRIADVASEAAVNDLIDWAEAEFGPIDLFCSNAGISHPGGPEVSNEDLEHVFDINYRSHLYAARSLVPKMTARGGGLPAQYGVRSRCPNADRLARVCRHQARRSSFGGVAGGQLRRPRAQGLRALPAGSAYPPVAWRARRARQFPDSRRHRTLRCGRRRD